MGKAIRKKKGGTTKDDDAFALSKEEMDQIRALDQNAARAKLALADADLRVASAEAARSDARTAFARASESYSQRVLAALKDRGVDVNDPKEKWHFDGATMTFRKKE